MNILFIGDIVGKSGRDVVSSLLSSIKSEYDINLVIANGENSAHGKGITSRIYHELLDYGIDYITMGNHTYSKSEINDYLNEMNKLVVPYNHSKRTTNNYYSLINYKEITLCLTNILGSALIPETNIDPYTSFEKVIDDTKQYNPDFYFVDLHAETTAEKRLFVEYFKDKAKIVIGTHTHVQTADEIMIGDCAFISDVGMCGPYNSIIGRDINETIESNIHHLQTRYTISDDKGIFCAVVIEVDEKIKKPVSIKRIQIRP